MNIPYENSKIYSIINYFNIFSVTIVTIFLEYIGKIAMNFEKVNIIKINIINKIY